MASSRTGTLNIQNEPGPFLLQYQGVRECLKKKNNISYVKGTKELTDRNPRDQNQNNVSRKIELDYKPNYSIK